jgi:hypothetical protein
MKTCCVCKIKQPKENFCKNTQAKDGLNYQCKSCKKIIGKKYYWSDTERESNRKKEYYIKNKEILNKKIYKYKKERKKTDKLFKFSEDTRRLIRQAFKRRGFTKNTKTYQILGCSFEDFKIHLENQFVPGMNWGNRNKWHIDHIVPVSLGKTEEEIIKLNHYTNLRPLWAEENLKKGSKYEQV